MTEDSSARITLKELYLQVQKIQSMLEKLSHQLPSMSHQLDDLEREVSHKLSDHEARLRKVEMRVWQMMAIASAIAAIAPFLTRLMS